MRNSGKQKMANEKGDGYTGGRLLNTICIFYSTIMIERIGQVFAIVILAYEILSNGLFWIHRSLSLPSSLRRGF